MLYYFTVLRFPSLVDYILQINKLKTQVRKEDNIKLRR